MKKPWRFAQVLVGILCLAASLAAADAAWKWSGSFSGKTVEILAIVAKSEAESWLAQFADPE